MKNAIETPKYTENLMENMSKGQRQSITYANIGIDYSDRIKCYKLCIYGGICTTSSSNATNSDVEHFET